MNCPRLSRTLTSSVTRSTWLTKVGLWGVAWPAGGFGGACCPLIVTTLARSISGTGRLSHCRRRGRAVINVGGGVIVCISVPDYDIPGVVLVWRVLSAVFTSLAALPAAAAAPAAGQLGRDRIPASLDVGAIRANSGLVLPVVRVEPARSLGQAIALLGRPGPPRDPLIQLREARAQPRSLRSSEHPSQRRVVLNHGHHRNRRRTRRPFPATLRAVLGPAGGTLAPAPLARIGARRRHRLPKQPHPVERQVRMCVLEGLAHFSVQWLAANLCQRR